MINLQRKAMKMISKMAYQTAKKEANTNCLCIAYQPKMPEALKLENEKKRH